MPSEYSQELFKTALNLRNRGILLVVGAKSGAAKYRKIYSRLDTATVHRKYTNSRFIGRCSKIYLSDNIMSYRFNDPFGTRLKVFWKTVLRRYEELNSMYFISEKIRNILQNATADECDREMSWEIHLYKRYSKFRKDN